MGIDKQHYGDAALEVANGQIDSALYVKALTIADGDDKKARAVYIGLMAEELQSEARKATVARAVGGAAGLTVGTAQAAVTVAQHFPFRSAFAVLVGIAVAVLTFAISLAAGGSIMYAMNYDMEYPLNMLLLVLGCGVFAFVVGRSLGKYIWQETRPSA
jgi:hypothetical protein